MPPSHLVRASSVADALNIVGDRWSLLILAEAFQGASRFTDWRERVGIASNILSDRLKHLVASGCLEPINRAGLSRVSEYRLTQMGRELYPTALMLWRFARTWGSDQGRSALLVHRDCGRPIMPKPVCRSCGKQVKARDVRYEDGPGAGLAPRAPVRLSRRASPSDEGAHLKTPFSEAVDLIGDRSTQLVISSFFLGARRHDEIANEWGIATNVLADRLKRLVEEGVVQRRLYQSSPDRYEYLLTPKGLDLYPIILAQMCWGDRWLASSAGPPMLLFHIPCGQRLDLAIVCDRCNGELDLQTVDFGAGAMSRRSGGDLTGARTKPSTPR